MRVNGLVPRKRNDVGMRIPKRNRLLFATPPTSPTDTMYVNPSLYAFLDGFIIKVYTSLPKPNMVATGIYIISARIILHFWFL